MNDILTDLRRKPHPAKVPLIMQRAADEIEGLYAEVKYLKSYFLNHAPINAALRAEVERLKGRWVCNKCGHFQQREAEVRCWKCGVGMMAYRETHVEETMDVMERNTPIVWPDGLFVGFDKCPGEPGRGHE
jgi:hypothetical protein